MNCELKLQTVKYLPKGFTARHAWQQFGKSGRPFKRRNKRKIK